MSKLKIEQSMMLTSSNWGPHKTFKLIPVTPDCPYVEAIFDPTSKILAVISKVSKQAFHMIPKLDDNGDPINVKIGKRSNGKDFKEQRSLMQTNTEYYISDKADIESLVKGFAFNADSFDYNIYFEELKDDPNAMPSSKATNMSLM